MGALTLRGVIQQQHPAITPQLPVRHAHQLWRAILVGAKTAAYTISLRQYERAPHRFHLSRRQPARLQLRSEGLDRPFYDH